MLEELHVADLALIEDVWLELGPGLTVLTGETGAGKTVLVGALKLLLGDRADPTMVRSGAAEAVVEGRFVLDGTEHAARRRISAEGRSRCYLDGEMSTVSGLSGLLGPLVDLHGQHDHQALLAPASHASYLDRFIGEPARQAQDAYRAAWKARAELALERDRLAEAMRDRERHVESLAARIAEIDALDPRPGEDEEIERRLPMLRHGERLTAAASAGYRALREDGGASDIAAEAAAAMRGATGLDPTFDGLLARVEKVVTELDDVGSEMRRYGEGVSHDPAALNEAESRLAALADARRKYGPTLGDVIAARAEAAERLDALESGGQGLRRAEERLEASETELVGAAAALSALREGAVDGFVTRLGEAARDLAMPSAEFGVACAGLPRDSWTAEGPQRIEFLFTSNQGEPPRPLARIASGGEVSRVMLALKSVLGAADVVPVLVFDEVDSGIGGATALAVGRRLASLAARHQVLVVTHLAQVAAYADHHMVVEKADEGGRAVTRVRTVAGEARVAEIARMLSGSDTETGLAHARELIGTVTAGDV